MGRVVHDHVDAGQVLERTDVAALAADDPPLHVVARELDDRDRGLGRVAGGDPLQRIGHERPRASPRLRAGLLLHLSHRPRELVADEVLRAFEHGRLGLAERHPRDPLELLQRLHARRLEVVLQLLQVHLAVADPLLATGHLEDLVVDLRLALRDALLDLRDLDAPVLHLAFGVGPEPHGELARLDLCLATDGLRLALGVRDDALPLLLAAAHPRRARRPQPRTRGDPTDPEPDDQGDQREHVHSSRRVGHQPRRRRGRPHPSSPAPAGLSRSRLAHPPAQAASVPAGARVRWSTRSRFGFGSAQEQGNPDEACSW